MQFQPFEPGIEVNGQTVNAIVDGFSSFRLAASKILLAENIGVRGPGGLVQLDPTQWYSQSAWLRAFERISSEVGEAVLFQIGQAIPRNAKFPPWVKDVESALRAIDVAYHMNHRKRGVALFNPTSGVMSEGIGHYGCERGKAERTIVSVCDNPYPCAFDRGIITAMAQGFEPKAKVVHDDTKPCRKQGAESCTYIASW
jgi:hypothetical protein